MMSITSCNILFYYSFLDQRRPYRFLCSCTAVLH